jgi:hypothetical protein
MKPDANAAWLLFKPPPPPSVPPETLTMAMNVSFDNVTGSKHAERDQRGTRRGRQTAWRTA